MISWHRIVYYTANKNMINMKQAILNPAKTISLLFASMIISIITFAQDKKIDVNVNTKSGDDNFFMQPWVWIVGGAVFLLLLVALMRNNSSKN